MYYFSTTAVSQLNKYNALPSNLITTESTPLCLKSTIYEVHSSFVSSSTWKVWTSNKKRCQGNTCGNQKLMNYNCATVVCSMPTAMQSICGLCSNNSAVTVEQQEPKKICNCSNKTYLWTLKFDFHVLWNTLLTFLTL